MNQTLLEGENLNTQPTPTPGNDSNETLIIVPRLQDRKTGKFKAVNALDVAAGGREKLMEVIEHAPQAAKTEHLLNLLADPGRANMRLEEICKDAGITYREMLGIYRDGSMAKAFTEANLAMGRKLALIAADVAEKAANHVEPCGCVAINGSADEGCKECNGKGLVYFRGSLDHQRMVFESTGLVKKGGGVNVQVNQQVAVGGGGIFEKFVKATDSAAYGAKIVDAEVKDVEEA